MGKRLVEGGSGPCQVNCTRGEGICISPKTKPLGLSFRLVEANSTRRDLGSPKGKEYDVVSFFFVSFSNNTPVFVFLLTLNLQLSYTFVIPKSYVWALVVYLGPTRE